MPGFNGTGPMGQGPMTGRGMGPCGQGSRPGFGRGTRPGFGRGYGLGRGRGFGFWRGWRWPWQRPNWDMGLDYPYEDQEGRK